MMSQLGGPEAWETSETVEEADQQARRLLSRVTERIGAEGSTVEESHLRVGKPDKEIVRLAGELDADLVVLGSRGSAPSVESSWPASPTPSSITPRARCWWSGKKTVARVRPYPDLVVRW